MKIHKGFNHRKFNCENHSTTKPRISECLGSKEDTHRGLQIQSPLPVHRNKVGTVRRGPVLLRAPTQRKGKEASYPGLLCQAERQEGVRDRAGKT